MAKRVKKKRSVEITEDNCKQVLLVYAMQHYPQEMENTIPDCPYNLGGLNSELAFTEFAEWFISERIQPSTGKTVVREFVEKYEGIMESGLKEKLLQLEAMSYGEFEVIETDDTYVLLLDITNGTRYIVKLFDENRAIFKVGRIIRGRIHPWGEVYRFAGIIHTELSDEEVARRLGLITQGMVDSLMGQYDKNMIKKAESIILSQKSTLSSVLNKYPAQWVDGICKALGIAVKGDKREKVKLIVAKYQSREIQVILEGLPLRCKEALKLVLEKGGWVKYSQLKSRFDDEITRGWAEDPPKSTIGIIRLHALLIVGKMGISGRMYKIAVVPLELREVIAKYI
ncbi:MAG TPA: hypothetical protein EYP28_03305 [Methanophagales archaeon]|nr:hypothetical protein [Methanophagales archaeon]